MIVGIGASANGPERGIPTRCARKNPLSGIEKRVCDQFRQSLELLEDFGGVTSNRTDALFRQLAFGECVIHFHV